MERSPGSAVLKLVVALAILFACGAVAWMVFLPQLVARFVRGRTGFDVQIQSLYCNPFTADLAVRGLVIANPPTFPRTEFVSVREFKIDARCSSFFGRRWEVNDATLDVAQVAIVRDREGRVNARLFQQGLAGSAGNPSAGAARKTEAKTQRGFLIRHLTVRIDRMLVADYSVSKPETREYTVNFTHTYENVTSASQVATPLAGALGNLAGVLAGALPESGGFLHEVGDSLGQAGRKTGEAVKGFFESLEKSLRK